MRANSKYIPTIYVPKKKDVCCLNTVSPTHLFKSVLNSGKMFSEVSFSTLITLWLRTYLVITSVNGGSYLFKTKKDFVYIYIYIYIYIHILDSLSMNFFYLFNFLHHFKIWVAMQSCFVRWKSTKSFFCFKKIGSAIDWVMTKYEQRMIDRRNAI